MTREEYDKIQKFLSYKFYHCFHLGGKAKEGYKQGIIDARHLIREFYCESLKENKEID